MAGIPPWRTTAVRVPLAAAAFKGYGSVIEAMLDMGAETDGCGPDGKTALMMAAMFKPQPTSWTFSWPEVAREKRVTPPGSRHGIWRSGWERPIRPRGSRRADAHRHSSAETYGAPRVGREDDDVRIQIRSRKWNR